MTKSLHTIKEFTENFQAGDIVTFGADPTEFEVIITPTDDIEFRVASKAAIAKAKQKMMFVDRINAALIGRFHA